MIKQFKTQNQNFKAEKNFDRILSLVQKSGKPFIIKQDDRGVAAVIPYIDPQTSLGLA